MPGLFLVLEGGDGSGKSSQIRLLETFFRRTRANVEVVHFPRLDVRPYGPLVAQFLRGDFGSLAGVHPKLVALLYALDRKEAADRFARLLAEETVVLADRYIFSNLAYQCAKVGSEDERRELAAWIEELEYGFHRIPRPDLTLYLDVPRDFARANLAAERGGEDRAYLQGKADIHEASDSLQERVREEFLTLAKTRPDEMAVVDCRADDGRIAPPEVVHGRIVETLRKHVDDF